MTSAYSGLASVLDVRDCRIVDLLDDEGPKAVSDRDEQPLAFLLGAVSSGTD